MRTRNFPGSPVVRTPCSQCTGLVFDPWSGNSSHGPHKSPQTAQHSRTRKREERGLGPLQVDSQHWPGSVPPWPGVGPCWVTTAPLQGTHFDQCEMLITVSHALCPGIWSTRWTSTWRAITPSSTSTTGWTARTSHPYAGSRVPTRSLTGGGCPPGLGGVEGNLWFPAEWGGGSGDRRGPGCAVGKGGTPRARRSIRVSTPRGQGPLSSTVVQGWVGSHARLSARACLAVSDSLWPPGLEPARLFGPWDFPGRNTGVGCHFLLP